MNATERLSKLLDAVEDSILNASDEEILNEILDEGRDPEAVASDVGNLLRQRIAGHRKRKLAAARKGYRYIAGEAARPSVRTLPEDPTERRTLLASVIASHAGIPRAITVAFREGKRMSDKDVLTTLEDLAELGFLDEGSG